MYSSKQKKTKNKVYIKFSSSLAKVGYLQMLELINPYFSQKVNELKSFGILLYQKIWVC